MLILIFFLNGYYAISVHFSGSRVRRVDGQLTRQHVLTQAPLARAGRPALLELLVITLDYVT